MGADSGHYKDTALDELARVGNVAQFVSFDPGLVQRHARVAGFAPDHRFPDPGAAVEALLQRGQDGAVNIRSFHPLASKSRQFIYGLTERGEVETQLRRLAADGLHTVVNETIDIHDGGVSGVVFGNVIEFAPDDTPRAVDAPGAATLPTELGLRMLETVYGFRPDLPTRPGLRVEFSLHPLRRGFATGHTILWEAEEYDGQIQVDVAPAWPNRFSRFLGDKVFGLLVADAVGLPVPEVTVFGRRVASFRFGRPTGSAERWIRTAPTEQAPGRFTTHRGWLDPFNLLADEDPAGDHIAAVIDQRSVPSTHAGVAANDGVGGLTIEGVAGFGDGFMVGAQRPEELPGRVEGDVRKLVAKAESALGPVRMEWVHDGQRAWVVQLHRGATESHADVVFPGRAESYVRFAVGKGLEELRQLVGDLAGSATGIILVGDVGVMSHLGDVLRRARIPSRIERSPGAADDSRPTL